MQHTNGENWGPIGYILSVIEVGYKIPFKEISLNQKCRNNRFACDNPEFVSKESKFFQQRDTYHSSVIKNESQ